MFVFPALPFSSHLFFFDSAEFVFFLRRVSKKRVRPFPLLLSPFPFAPLVPWQLFLTLPRRTTPTLAIDSIPFPMDNCARLSQFTSSFFHFPPFLPFIDYLFFKPLELLLLLLASLGFYSEQCSVLWIQQSADDEHDKRVS
jgi:hypothetical protein